MKNLISSFWESRVIFCDFQLCASLCVGKTCISKFIEIFLLSVSPGISPQWHILKHVQVFFTVCILTEHLK